MIYLDRLQSGVELGDRSADQLVPRPDQLQARGLRSYQSDSIAAVRSSYATGHHAPLLVMPTAAGKTIVFRETARLAQLKGTRTLAVVHRRELLKQASTKLADAGVAHGIIAAGFQSTPDATVQVASIQSAIRRDIGTFGYVICDEAHHAVASTWRKVLVAQPKAKLLGCTATPARLDGKGLGKDHGGLFDDLIIGATVAELTEAGWLCPARVFVAKTKLNLRGIHVVAGDYAKGELERAVMAADLAGDAVAEYQRHADHQPCAVFCVSIQHAKVTAETFALNGYRAAVVHGELPMPERDRLVAALGTGEVELLSSCEILGEGIDIPAIGCAILLRPTRSLAVYLQQVGRGLRPAPGKSHLTVLDLAGNALEHGLPDEERHWTLAGAPKRQAGQPPGWTCTQCGCLNAMSATFCADCGAQRPTHLREFSVNPHDELVELRRRREREIAALTYRQFMSQPRSRREFEVYQHAHGYKKGWIWHAEQKQAAMFGAPT